MRIVFTTLVLCIGFALSAQIDFHTGDFASALAKAEEENKPLLLDAYTDWCGPCKMLDVEVFEDEKMAQYINENFVAYKLDMEKGQGPLVAMKFGVQSYPTTLFLSPAGKLVSKEIGFPGKDGYMEWCEKVVTGKAKAFENIDAHDLELDFPDFYKYAFVSDQWERKRPELEEINAYLSQQENLATEINWSVVKCMAFFKHDYVAWAAENSRELQALYPAEEVTRLCRQYISSLTGNLEELGSIEEVERKVTAVIDSVNPAGRNEIRYQILKDAYFSRKEWEPLLDLVHEEGDPRPDLINSICWHIFLDDDAPELVDRAITEVHSAIEEDPHPNIIDTLAHLYYKKGQKDKARQYAEEAMQKGKAAGMEMKETGKLLEKLKT